MPNLLQILSVITPATQAIQDNARAIQQASREAAGFSKKLDDVAKGMTTAGIEARREFDKIIAGMTKAGRAASDEIVRAAKLKEFAEKMAEQELLLAQAADKVAENQAQKAILAAQEAAAVEKKMAYTHEERMILQDILGLTNHKVNLINAEAQQQASAAHQQEKSLQRMRQVADAMAFVSRAMAHSQKDILDQNLNKVRQVADAMAFASRAMAHSQKDHVLPSGRVISIQQLQQLATEELRAGLAAQRSWGMRTAAIDQATAAVARHGRQLQFTTAPIAAANQRLAEGAATSSRMHFAVFQLTSGVQDMSYAFETMGNTTQAWMHAIRGASNNIGVLLSSSMNPWLAVVGTLGVLALPALVRHILRQNLSLREGVDIIKAHTQAMRENAQAAQDLVDAKRSLADTEEDVTLALKPKGQQETAEQARARRSAALRDVVTEEDRKRFVEQRVSEQLEPHERALAVEGDALKNEEVKRQQRRKKQNIFSFSMAAKTIVKVLNSGLVRPFGDIPPLKEQLEQDLESETALFNALKTATETEIAKAKETGHLDPESAELLKAMRAHEVEKKKLEVERKKATEKANKDFVERIDRGDASVVSASEGEVRQATLAQHFSEKMGPQGRLDWLQRRMSELDAKAQDLANPPGGRAPRERDRREARRLREQRDRFREESETIKTKIEKSTPAELEAIGKAIGRAVADSILSVGISGRTVHPNVVGFGGGVIP